MEICSIISDITYYFLRHLLGPLIIGVCALGGAVWSVRKTFQEQRQINKERQDKTIDDTLWAIYEELSVIRKAYKEEVESLWERFKREEYKIFWFNLSLTQDYCTVYSSNANLIGQVPDPLLRRRIVEVYTLLKVLIDYYTQNNRLLDDIEKKGIGAAAAEANKENQEFTQRLKECHLRFKALKIDVLEKIEEKFPELNNQASTKV